jgi:hypothetical protein
MPSRLMVLSFFWEFDSRRHIGGFLPIITVHTGTLTSPLLAPCTEQALASGSLLAPGTRSRFGHSSPLGLSINFRKVLFPSVRMVVATAFASTIALARSHRWFSGTTSFPVLMGWQQLPVVSIVSWVFSVRRLRPNISLKRTNQSLRD